MRDGRFLVVGVLAVLLAAGSMAPAPSADVARVDVLSNLYTPELTSAAPGTHIEFVWGHGGHSVTAVDGSFDSGVLGAGSRYNLIFPGGVMRFRCTVHSWIDQQTGQCNGMCGQVTQQTQDIEPPHATVIEPANGAVQLGQRGFGALLGSVYFRGTATDDRSVTIVRLRLRRELTGWQEYSVVCDRCGTASASWSTTVALLPGRYEVFAMVADPSANVGRSPSVTFTVV